MCQLLFNLLEKKHDPVQCNRTEIDLSLYKVLSEFSNDFFKI